MEEVVRRQFSGGREEEKVGRLQLAVGREGNFKKFSVCSGQGREDEFAGGSWQGGEEKLAVGGDSISVE